MRPPFLPRQRQTLSEAAIAWMRARPPVAPPELPALFDQAHVYLERQFPRAGAAQICAETLAAWASVDGERTECRVDLEASTPHLIVLVDPIAGQRRKIPVSDLVRLLGPRAAS